MVLDAAAAAFGAVWDFGLKAVSFAARLRNLQPIKGHAPRASSSAGSLKKGRLQHDGQRLIGYDASDWQIGVERGGLHVRYASSGWSDSIEDSGAEFNQLARDWSAAPQNGAENLDVLECILVLFPQESTAAVCGQVDVLPVDVVAGFKAVVGVLKNKATIEDVPEIEMKLDLISEACGRIMDDISEANKSGEKRFPDRTLRDVDVAADSATELYGFAKRVVSDKLNRSGAMSREAKLQAVPYIVALAYAARIRVITIVVEMDMASQESGKEGHLTRASKVVDDFIAVVYSALDGLMADTSLAEIALDYELPVAMYLTLMRRFRASIDVIKPPGTDLNDMAAFDDGLSSIRAALYWHPSGAGYQAQGRTIELSTVDESTWWARFTGTDTRIADLSKLKERFDIRELAHVLGAGSDGSADALALKPGQKSALLKIPPAVALRTTLCINIAQALQAIYPDRPMPAPPPSFACISRPPPRLRPNRGPAPAAPARRQIPAAASAHVKAVADEFTRLQVAVAPRTLSSLSRTVLGVAVCADGERVVAGSLDTTVRVWSLRTGECLLTLRGHSEKVNCVAASPDGKTAVSGSTDKTLCVWSLESGQLQHTLHGHDSQVLAVAMSPDGRTFASGSADRTIKLWNADTACCVCTLSGHTDSVLSVAFSPDGQRLVSGSRDKSICVWNLRTHELELTLHGHSGDVRGVAVTPDGSRLVSGSWDGTVNVWSLSSGKVEKRLIGHAGEVSSVAVFPDGQRIASGSWDKSVRVWNWRSGALETTLAGHSEWVECLSVSGDGRSVVSGSWDNTIKVWDLSGGGNGGGNDSGADRSTVPG